MSGSGRFGRDFGAVLAGQVLTFAQGLVLMPIIIRTAGAAVFGAYVLIMSVMALFFSALGYGIPYRYQRNIVSAATPTGRRALFEPQFTFQILAVAVVAAVILLLGRRLEHWLFRDSVSFSPGWLAALMAAQLLHRQAVDYFQYTRRFLHFSIATNGAAYLFVAMLSYVAADRGVLSLDMLLALQILASLLACAPLLPQLIREIGLPRPRLHLQQLIADARLGLPLSVELIVDFVLRSSDRYLILAFLSVSAVGSYQPAYTIGAVAIFFISMMDTILVPALSRLVDVGQREEAGAMMATVLRLFFMVAVPIVIGALMTGPSLVGLLATREIGALSRWVAPLVAAATIFYGIVRLASTAAFVIGRTTAILAANAAGAAVNLLLNLVLLPLLRDITVAAATTLAGYLVDYVCLVWTLRAIWPFEVDWNSILRYLAAAMGMGAFLWFLGFHVGEVADMGAIALALRIAAAIPVYFVLLLLLGAIGREEMAQLVNLARREVPSTGRSA